METLQTCSLTSQVSFASMHVENYFMSNKHAIFLDYFFWQGQ